MLSVYFPSGTKGPRPLVSHVRFLWDDLLLLVFVGRRGSAWLRSFDQMGNSNRLTDGKCRNTPGHSGVHAFPMKAIQHVPCHLVFNFLGECHLQNNQHKRVRVCIAASCLTWKGAFLGDVDRRSLS